MERLRANDAIEGIRGHILGPTEVGDDGSPPVGLIDVQYVTLRYPITTVFPREGGVFDLQHPSSYVPTIAGQKPLDVVAIDGPAPVQPELATDGLHPPEISETQAPNRRTTSLPARPSNPPLQTPVLLPEPLDLL